VCRFYLVLEFLYCPSINRPMDSPAGLPERKPAPFLAWLYLIYALPAIILLSIANPPFQVPDEYSHAMRADQVSRGTLISPGGGGVDGGWRAFGQLYVGIPFHPERKHTVEMARAAAAMDWNLPDYNESFSNTAQYGPPLYLPQAVGIWIGKLAGLGPVWTNLCARLVNGLTAMAIGFLAICWCRRGRALLFTTLLFPVTLAQFSSVSQDALVISLSLLAIALASRVIDEARPSRVWEFALFVFIVVATTLARAPQIALGLLGLALVDWRDPFWRSNAAIAAAGAICVAAWIIYLPSLMPSMPKELSVSIQFHALVSNPLLLPTLVARTLYDLNFWLFGHMVGTLGWGDAPSPRWYVRTAAAVVVCAWLAPGNRPPWAFPAALGLATFVAVLMTLGAALYISWTPIGKTTIDGYQGRYILAILPLLAWTAPNFRSLRVWGIDATSIIVSVFPLLSFAVLPGVIMARYYESWSAMGVAIKALYF
jgi:hypothetical protein